MPFEVNDQSIMKYFSEYGAYFISLGQAKDSLARYVYNTPFFYQGKTYIMATEYNADKLPSQSIHMMTAKNTGKVMCKFPDTDEVIWKSEQ
jgi:hypothetical protein